MSDMVGNHILGFPTRRLNNLSLFFPRWIIELSDSKSQEEVIDRKQNIENINSLIFEQTKTHKETYDKNSIRDFVDLYLQTML